MREVFLGIDVGTTATKAILVDGEGQVVASCARDYPLSVPRPGWVEQDPAAWWEATVESIRGVLAAQDVRVASVGLTGQMHGLVILDQNGQVLRPAILWNDQRTAEEAAWITRQIGAERVLELTANPVLTGFTAPKILWVRRHEPHVYGRIAHLLLPKDYVRYRLTAVIASDVTDSSGTSLFDVRRRQWSEEMLAAVGIPRAWLPDVFESPEVVGSVSEEAAARTGLPAGAPVVAGAGDQAAQAVGAGIVQTGLVSVTIGTSGVVFAHLETVQVDPLGRTHTFCHAVPGRWHVMGVTLAAGGSLRWLRDSLAVPDWHDYGRMIEEAENVPPGSEGLLFLPYLSGERTPHADPFARGAFVGLTLRHRRGHLVRAVLEGVAFALRDSLEILRAMGLFPTEIRISGGGARSPLWRRILADALGAELVTVEVTEGAAYGAALLAAVGVGAFPSVEAACKQVVRGTEHVSPSSARKRYDELYRAYVELYPTLSDTMHVLSRLSEGT